MRLFWISAVVVALAASRGLPAGAQEDDSLEVLTALPVVYSITSALTEGTSIVVRNLPERPRPMSALGNFFETAAERFGDALRRANAVVTIGKLWGGDPLFTAVRAENIHVVDIDATKPWSTTLEGVSVAFEPGQTVEWAESGEAAREPSVYYWLSPSNGARSAEIIAADLMRLSPSDSERIRANLDAYRRALVELKHEYEVKFLGLPSLRVFALAPEFVYLTTDMGVFVDGTFFKQDIDWTEDDLANLRRYLADGAVPVAIHKWEPAEPIRAAVEDAGARLVVLDIGDLGIVEEGALRTDSYLAILRANLEALYGGLGGAN